MENPAHARKRITIYHRYQNHQEGIKIRILYCTQNECPSLLVSEEKGGEQRDECGSQLPKGDQVVELGASVGDEITGSNDIPSR